jgi:hypothetical protein
MFGILSQLGYTLIYLSDFLKERLFGLSNPQGNHGESLKECHFHLDNTPTASTLLLAHGLPLTHRSTRI